MKLHSTAFRRITKGTKTLELRLYDDKRKTIKLHDEIKFSELPELEQTVLVKVTGLLIYPTFASIIDDLPASYMGYQENEKDYLRTSMYEVYTSEDEARYGVLGIRFVVIQGGNLEEDNLNN